MKNDDLLIGLRFNVNAGDAEDRLKAIEAALGKIKDTTGLAGAEFLKLPKKAGKGAGETADKLTILNNKLKTIHKSLEKVAKASKYIFMGLSGIAGVSIKKFADMEAGILKVQTISKNAFDTIEKRSRKMALKYGIDVGQILEGNYQLVSSMSDVKDAQKMLDTTAKLSKAGFTGYADAMNGLITILNGYKMGVDQATRVSDVLITIQNQGITTVGELQDSLSRLTTVATATGLSFEDMSASMATITANKVKTAEAVTYMNGMLAELGDTSTEVAGAFQRATGQDFKSYLKSGKSYIEGLIALERELIAEGKDIVSIFGNKSGAMAFLNLVGKNTNKFKNTLREIEESAGATDKALNKLSKGLKDRFSKLKARLTDITISIGKALLPTVEKFVAWLEKINWDKIFSEKNVARAVSIGKKVAVVTGIMWGLHKALQAVIDVLAIKVVSGTILGMISAGSIASFGALATAIGGVTLAIKKMYDEITKGEQSREQMRAENSKTENKAKFWRKSKQRLEDNKIFNMYDLHEFTHSGEDEAIINKLIALNGQYRKAKGKEKDDLYYQMIKLYDGRIWNLENTSNNGYLSKPVGYKMNDEDRKDLYAPIRKENIEKQAQIEVQNKQAEEDRKLFIQKTIDEYNSSIGKLTQFWDMIGYTDKEKFEGYLNFYKQKLNDSIEAGDRELVEHAYKKYKYAEGKVKEIYSKDALESYSKESSKNLGIEDTIQRYNKEIESTEKAIEELRKINSVKNKADIEELQAHVDYMKKLKDAREKEIKAAEEQAERTKDLTESLNVAIDGINTLANATGSKKIGMAGNMLGGISAISRASSSFKGIGSITGMFSGKEKAFATGLGSLGALAGGVGAGIGIISSIGGIFGRKGKKQKAKIEAENNRNKELYQQQVTVMQQLTQAIESNTNRIKSFSDKLLNNIAKNPTLTALTGGNTNLNLMKDLMLEGKRFNSIDAIEKGRKRYSKGWGRHGHKDTFTQITIDPSELLAYLGFDNTNINNLNNSEMHQLNEVLKQTTHEDLKRATGKNLSESNLNEWKKQIDIFVSQLDHLEKEKSELFGGATLESFSGIHYREQKNLIEEYTEMFKDLGLQGEHYNEVIKEMARNNQVLVTTMNDVRNSTINGFIQGKGAFIESSKNYFLDVYRNAGSIAYDIAFSDIDKYMSEQFESLSNKLVEIKKTEQLDFSHLFDDFDFKVLERADIAEKQALKSLDVIKKQLLNSGVDLSLINKILPVSDFNERIESLKDSLANAMNQALSEHSFFDFTKTLGQSLYDSTKGALVKAFSESSLYQGMIQKFIKAEDYQSKLEKAGSFKEAVELSEKIMEDFGHELEASGLGGFDAINNLKKEKNNMLGNAYYQDDNKGVNINITNNFNKDVYGLQDFQSIIRNTTLNGIKEYFNKPRILA